VRQTELAQVAIGGALGTGVRLLVALPAVLAVTGPSPFRLLALNVAGAGMLGALLGARERLAWLPRLLPLLGVGLLGGMTTFSSMILVAGRLGHDAGLVAVDSARMTGPGLGLAASYLLGSVVLGLVAFQAARAGARRGWSGEARLRDAEGDR
jgi:fluoride exporter